MPQAIQFPIQLAFYRHTHTRMHPAATPSESTAFNKNFWLSNPLPVGLREAVDSIQQGASLSMFWPCFYRLKPFAGRLHPATPTNTCKICETCISQTAHFTAFDRRRGQDASEVDRIGRPSKGIDNPHCIGPARCQACLLPRPL